MISFIDRPERNTSNWTSQNELKFWLKFMCNTLIQYWEHLRSGTAFLSFGEKSRLLKCFNFFHALICCDIPIYYWLLNLTQQNFSGTFFLDNWPKRSAVFISFTNSRFSFIGGNSEKVKWLLIARPCQMSIRNNR